MSQWVHFILFYFKVFLKILFYLFIFWLHWVFIAACRSSLVAASGGYSSLWCTGFSLQWLLLLQSTGSRRVGFSSCGMLAQQLWLAGSRAPTRVSSCSTWAQLLRGTWDLPGPGLEPMFPALAGTFLTTAPPGKPQQVHFMFKETNVQRSPNSFI